MEFAIGVGLALALFAGAVAVGLTRDKAFFAVAMLAIATYYVLFATMAGASTALVQESAVAALFIALAVIGFRSNQWLVVLAIGGHGLFDAVHHRFIANPGMPAWWPGFCGTFDLVFAACFAALLLVERRAGRSAGTPR
jgi:hypothetical protein